MKHFGIIKHVKKLKPYKDLSRRQYSTGVIIVGLVALVGVHFLFGSKALSPYIAVEAESGVVNSPAEIYSDPTASNGEAVIFGTGSSTGNNVPRISFYPGNNEFPQNMPGQPVAGQATVLPNLGHTVPLGEFYLSGNDWGTSQWGILSSLDTYWEGPGSSGQPWANYSYRPVIAVPMLANGNATTLTLTKDGQSDTDGDDYAAAAKTEPSPVSSFEDCATTAPDLPYGPYGQFYVALAKEMIAYGIKDPIVRLGWEFNGSWFGATDANTDFNPNVPYQDNFQNFIKCYQDEASALKTTDPQIMIDFNPSTGEPTGNTEANGDWVPLNWESLYPGNQYVDIIGLDMYDSSGNYPAGTNDKPSLLPCTGDTPGTSACTTVQDAEALNYQKEAWNQTVTGTGGLNDQVTFAAEHNKPMSFPEWGLWIGCYNDQCGGDDPYYISQVYSWVTTHNFYYLSYFNQDDNGSDNAINDGQFPNSLNTFTQLFTPLAAESPNYPPG